MTLLDIQELSVKIGDTQIINKLNLKIEAGKVYAIMGPNGSGKSTLAFTLLGHPSCNVVNGGVIFKGRDITDLAVDKRSKLGIFLSFQNPYEIPGLQVLTYLKEIYSLHQEEDISIQEFKEKLKEYLEVLNLDEAFLWRNLNDNFSGGEKKRMEMLQLMVIQPSLAIIDEVDSGLDVDALQVVAKALNFCRAKNPDMGILLITHYQRILEYIIPDFVHVICNGFIVESGYADLAKKVEVAGYAKYSFE